MKLISAVNDEHFLRIFVAVTDTKEDRLGESLDFTDWGLSQGNGGNVSVIEYDRKTKTAALMITSLGDNPEGGAALRVDGLTTGRELIENLPEDDIPIAALLQEQSPGELTMDEVWTRGGGGDIDLFKSLLSADRVDIPLQNGEMYKVSNMGFVDGLFRIQVKAALKDAALVDGYYINLKFLNAQKDLVYKPAARLDYITDKKYAYEIASRAPHDAYSEFVFPDITSPEQLEGLSMVMDYMKSPELIEGQWEFSFKVPGKTKTEYEIGRTLPINGEDLEIDTISLSPFGITVHLFKNLSENYLYHGTVSVVYEDGTQIKLDQSSIHTYEYEPTLIFTGEIIETERVRKLIINGEDIDLIK